MSDITLQNKKKVEVIHAYKEKTVNPQVNDNKVYMGWEGGTLENS